MLVLGLQLLFFIRTIQLEPQIRFNPRSLERGGGGDQIDPHPPSIFWALNFYFLTDCQKLWHNFSLFVNTSFDTN